MGQDTSEAPVDELVQPEDAATTYADGEVVSWTHDILS